MSAHGNWSSSAIENYFANVVAQRGQTSEVALKVIEHRERSVPPTASSSTLEGVPEAKNNFGFLSAVAQRECATASGPPVAASKLAAQRGAKRCRVCTTLILVSDVFTSCRSCGAKPIHARCLVKSTDCCVCGGEPGPSGLAKTTDSWLRERVRLTAGCPLQWLQCERGWLAGDLVQSAGGVVHRVAVCSRDEPVGEWAAFCGWKFASSGVRVSDQTFVSCADCWGIRYSDKR